LSVSHTQVVPRDIGPRLLVDLVDRAVDTLPGLLLSLLLAALLGLFLDARFELPVKRAPALLERQLSTRSVCLGFVVWHLAHRFSSAGG
jgi:hypothetical protein